MINIFKGAGDTKHHEKANVFSLAKNGRIEVVSRQYIKNSFNECQQNVNFNGKLFNLGKQDAWEGRG